MAVLSEIWRKLSASERLAVVGAVLIVLSWLLGALMSGFFGLAGAGGVSLLGAIAVGVVVYLQHAPNTKISWPASYPVVLFGIGVVVGLLALVELLDAIRWLGLLASILSLGFWVPFLLYLAGAALLAWGSFKTWEASKGTA
jgi:hypothetical protein